MNKTLMIVLVVGLLLVGCVSAYYCISPNDNQAVQEFKQKLNILSINEDIKWGMTEEAIATKIKLFNPCNK